MKTETVNIDKWKTFDWGAIQPNKKVPVHIEITTMDSELIADVYNKDHAELIKEATNACKEINKDSPLNVAKAIPELFEACIKSLKVFKQLADAGHYPFPLMADNGGEGLKFLCDAIEKATEQ